VWVMAQNEIEIRAEHIAGQENRLADYLSRWHVDSKYEWLAWSEMYKHRFDWTEVDISESMLECDNVW